MLDGLCVQVLVYGPEEGEVQVWTGTFLSPEYARHAVEAVLLADAPTGLEAILDPGKA